VDAAGTEIFTSVLAVQAECSFKEFKNTFDAFCIKTPPVRTQTFNPAAVSRARTQLNLLCGYALSSNLYRKGKQYHRR